MIFTERNIYFSKSYQDFPEGFLLVLILLPECIITSDFLRLLDILAIFFCTNPDIDKVSLDRIFPRGRVKWYSERHWICTRQRE